MAQVIQHRAELGVRDRRSDVDHHVQDRLPVVAVVSRVRHLRQRVANGAVALHYRLGVAFRQIHRSVGFDFVRASEELRSEELHIDKRLAGAAQARKLLSST